MTLNLPQGFVPPENARPGEPFEVVATIQANEDGSFELLAVDGAKVAEEDEASKFAKKIPLPWGEG